VRRDAAEKEHLVDIVLIPGLWLDASSWDRVLPVIEAGGHRPIPLTLPGLEARDADRSAITLQDNVDAVLAAIDAADGPVLLVGHSMGAGLASIALDARPGSVARVLYVGGFPASDGEPLGESFTAVEGEVPLPDLAEFDAADLRDLDETALADFRARAIPSPAGLLHDVVHLRNERRYDVPAVAVCPEYTSEQLKAWIDGGEESVQEFTRIRELEYVDVPTGHWPQFTRPEELGRVVVEAADRS
jgi:pimeloyl-ACP methyl ester carboxylesterase